MTIPANLSLEAAPYGPQPVVRYVGPQGGPYTVDGPLPVVLLASAIRTSNAQTALQINPRYRGLYLRLAVTVNPGGAQTLAVQLNGVDVTTGNGAALLAVPASATPGGNFLIYPGASGAAVEGVTQTRNLLLPDQWNVAVIHSGVGAWTYTLTAVLLP